MTKRERQLMEDGYSFTGIYERNKGAAKNRALQKQRDGYYAVVVTIPDSPLSRGTVGKGYSVYAKPTAKKEAMLEAKKEAAITQRKADVKAIEFHLLSRTKESLIEYLIEALGGKDELIPWARKKQIIE